MSESVPEAVAEVKREEKRLTLLLCGVAVCLLGVAIYVNFFAADDSGYPTHPGAVYYTGPMKAKSGVGYGTIDGKPISDADAKAQADRWLKDYQSKKLKG